VDREKENKMLQTPEYHKILAESARRTAENMEAGARNPRFTEWDRVRYAGLARLERLHQAYHEEAALLRAQGRAVPEWIDWHQERERRLDAAV
jgi:hypothetical protein